MTEISKNLQLIVDASERFAKSWQSESDFQTLLTALEVSAVAEFTEAEHPSVHSALHQMLDVISAKYLDNDVFIKSAEKLVENCKITDYLRGSLINTLVFSVYFEKERFRESEAWLEKSIFSDSQSEGENSLNNLGIAYMRTGRQLEAIAIFMRACSIGDPDLRGEAIYHLAHLVGDCSKHHSKILIELVADDIPGRYTDLAQACLWGECSIGLKRSLGYKHYLSLEGNPWNLNYLEKHLTSWDKTIPLTESGTLATDFASPAKTLIEIKKHNGYTAELLEFCSLHSTGIRSLEPVLWALALESGLPHSLSLFAAITNSLWAHDEHIDDLIISAFLGQPDYDPSAHRLTNYIIHEKITRAWRIQPKVYQLATQQYSFENSLRAAMDDPVCASVIIQRSSDSLETLGDSLAKAAGLDLNSANASIVPMLIAELANACLEVVRTWNESAKTGSNNEARPRYAEIDFAAKVDAVCRRYPRLIREYGPKGARFVCLAKLDRTWNEFNEGLEVRSIDNMSFLAYCLLMLSSPGSLQLNVLVHRCIFVLEKQLVSESITEVIESVLQMAWQAGGRIPWSSEIVQKLPKLMQVVVASSSINDIFEIQSYIGDDSSSRGGETWNWIKSKCSYEPPVEVLEHLSPSDYEFLATTADLGPNLYDHIYEKGDMELNARLAVNPSAMQILGEKILVEIRQNPRFAFICALATQVDKRIFQYEKEKRELTAQIPLAPELKAALLQTDNSAALAIMARDLRYADNDLRIIAAKANKDIAAALNNHPNASDETKALAQLVG